MRYFWIFMTALVCSDAYVVSHGIDGAFWRFKTEPELRLQEALIQRAASQPQSSQSY